MTCALTAFVLLVLQVVVSLASPATSQKPLNAPGSPRLAHISNILYLSLERLSRLVDITYCVGSTGISRPFNCISRCKDFPSLSLATTWNTGMLLTDSCGYIAVDPHKAIIVAFRGTYSITNMIVDLSTMPQTYAPYPSPDHGGDQEPEPEHVCHNCTVHMGFLASWRSAREEVMRVLRQLHAQHPDYPIQVVGHSLGGAVAALAALEMRVVLGWENVEVTTFGEPMVGNEGFVKYLDEVFDLNSNNTHPEQRTYRRVTHIDDPVPLLPLQEWGYRPHAGEIFISKPDLAPEPQDIRLCDGDHDQKCIDGSPGSGILSYDPLDDEAGRQTQLEKRHWGIPVQFKLWQVLFAHRDYFWRLGLCIPGGDPIDWGRKSKPDTKLNDEL